MIKLALMLVIAAAAPSDVQALSGVATAFSGDELVIRGRRIRLDGIAAPRIMQYCYGRTHEIYHCGREAQAALAGLIDRQGVHLRAFQ